jgi:hypothetical protein
MWAAVAGCGTDAVGVEACRSIESARCEAALACGLVQDVAQCRRFTRDHCLHGLAVEEPGSRGLARCVADIETAGSCARSNGRRSTVAECDEATLGTEAQRVCEIVQEPELAPRCQFLVPPEPEPEPDEEPEQDAGAD